MVESFVLFLILNCCLPFFLRIIFFDSSIPLQAQCIGFVEDFFVALELSLFMLLSVPLTALLGSFLQLYLLLDAMLYREMRLRMRLSDWKRLRDIRSLWDSARAMGLDRYLTAGSLIVSGYASAYFFLSDLRIDCYWIILGGTGSIAILGAIWLPKRWGYAVHNALFQEQINLIRSFGKKREIPTESLKGFSDRSGPKTFDIAIGAQEKPHIVFLFLESFAANAVGEATPRFNRLSQEGILFSNFYSNGTLTYRALISGLFGCPPGSTRGLLSYLNIPWESLPMRLKGAGYKSAFHHNGSLAYDYQREFLQKHFDILADRSDIEDLSFAGWGVHDEYLMEYSADFLKHQDHPTFLTLFTITNHHPWIVPEHYAAPVFSVPAPKSRFLQTMHYTDFALGRFVDLLRSKNLSKNTILFILGDHAHPMGEHAGNFYNSRFLYEENVHVPLLIWADGRIQRPTIIDELGSQIDLMPTILDLLNLPDFPSCGDSLMRSRPNRRVMLQNPYSEGFIGCREGNWKWVDDLCMEGELYDLSQDAHETKNLAADFPAVAEQLRSETRQFFAGIDHLYQNMKKDPPRASPCEMDCSEAMILDQELIDRVPSSIQKLNLQNCLLLTDRSIAYVLSHCPRLEELYLKGLTDLSDEVFDGVPFLNKLQLIHLPDAHRLTTDRGVGQLARLAPHLLELSLNARNLTDLGIRAIGQSCHHLIRLKLYEAHQITDEALIFLFQNNPHLGRVVIDGCDHLTDLALLSLQNHPIELLWIFDAPRLTDRGINDLAHLSIRSLAIKGCPLVTERFNSERKKIP